MKITIGSRFVTAHVASLYVLLGVVAYALGWITEGLVNTLILTWGGILVAYITLRGIQQVAKEKAAGEIPDAVGEAIINAAGKASSPPNAGGGYGDGRAY
jgi:ABC-type Co2+ transport system permease subunit